MPPQSVQVICPNLGCRSMLSAPASARGRIVRCGQCGTRIKVPAAAAPVKDASEE